MNCIGYVNEVFESILHGNDVGKSELADAIDKATRRGLPIPPGVLFYVAATLRMDDDDKEDKK